MKLMYIGLLIVAVISASVIALPSSPTDPNKREYM